MRPLGTAPELERRRTRAVELLKQDESPTVIARILGVGRTSLYRWKMMAQAAPEGLVAKPHPGPKVRLSTEQLQELETLLLQGAKVHGWPNALWTAMRVAEMIRRHFSVAYHVEHVRKILRHQRLWTSQKPQAKAKQRNTEAIDHGRTQELPVILKRAQDRKAHLVFLDESGLQTSPLVRRTYAPQAKRRSS